MATCQARGWGETHGEQYVYGLLLLLVLHETVILTPNVVSLLQNVARYNVLDPSTSAEAEAKAADTVEEISVDTVTHDTHKSPDNVSVTLEHSDRVSTPTQTNVVVADTHTQMMSLMLISLTQNSSLILKNQTVSLVLQMLITAH